VNLKKFVQEHFLWDAIVFNYLGLYRKILDNSKMA